ncbi:hypothetical protein [Nocardia asiatica]|uniref:hypothetical protein n=1 Tax=Nocardia asiatica TaxID=209252 RepID=UPI0002DF506C|nr:hypothetical protein [Nocardia asiatica]
MAFEWWAGVLAVLALTGVERHEVIEVLYADKRWPRRGVDPTTGLSVLSIWGRTDDGRPLIVTLRVLGGFDHQIVAAHRMTEEQLQEFRKWEETR